MKLVSNLELRTPWGCQFSCHMSMLLPSPFSPYFCCGVVYDLSSSNWICKHPCFYLNGRWEAFKNICEKINQEGNILAYLYFGCLAYDFFVLIEFVNVLAFTLMAGERSPTTIDVNLRCSPMVDWISNRFVPPYFFYE